ncbi:flavin reductase [uncultured Imperialibacter sp.]|uniref:flavin reductase family protein n=1 Tax=uncultured Imperialibacter sp. TaxID=1672639 RepID=UPI0030DC8E92|tara:strand:- start:11782 stop:12417 length:636 start_codon:yes stop_codon:yes gene_type:complete
MYLSKTDLVNTEKVRRLNIINSISGIKPGNLIGTRSNAGQANLAIISSVVHLGSNPAYLGFIVRPSEEVRRHTQENILDNGWFTINHIRTSFIKNAHYTSAKFDHAVSEFDACGLTEETLYDFHAPFVKESTLKIGLRHVEDVVIQSTGTTMIVGQIEHLVVPDEAINKQGYIDLGVADGVGISGLNSYYKLEKVADFPYARVSEVPDFSK